MISFRKSLTLVELILVITFSSFIVLAIGSAYFNFLQKFTHDIHENLLYQGTSYAMEHITRNIYTAITWSFPLPFYYDLAE